MLELNVADQLKTVAPAESWAGTQFSFPFHHTWHLRIWNLGTWLRGLAGIAMMALCILGVIIHRKIFTDFFTLRRSRQPHECCSTCTIRQAGWE